MKFVKKTELLTLLITLIFILWGFSAYSICRKSDPKSSLYNTCNKIYPVNKLLITPTPEIWKLYTDDKHGFSFQYPGSWNNKDSGNLDDFVSNGEPAGVAILTSSVENCISADKYLKEVLLTKYKDIQILPLVNQNIDGFVVEGYHLDDLTRGPEAYVVNCPYLIRIGFIPDNDKCDQTVFNKVISSMKTWKPAE